MSYINEYEALHKLAGKSPVTHSWRDASAWGLIAELALRLPPSETFLAYECPYAGGMYATVWYLRNNPTAENPQGDLQIRINNFGHVDIRAHYPERHHCLINDGKPSKKDLRFDTLDYILSPNPKQIVLEVESCYRNGDTLPAQAPATRRNIMVSLRITRTFSRRLKMLIRTPKGNHRLETRETTKSLQSKTGGHNAISF